MSDLAFPPALAAALAVGFDYRVHRRGRALVGHPRKTAAEVVAAAAAAFPGFAEMVQGPPYSG